MSSRALADTEPEFLASTPEEESDARLVEATLAEVERERDSGEAIEVCTSSTRRSEIPVAEAATCVLCGEPDAELICRGCSNGYRVLGVVTPRTTSMVEVLTWARLNGILLHRPTT